MTSKSLRCRVGCQFHAFVNQRVPVGQPVAMTWLLSRCNVLILFHQYRGATVDLAPLSTPGTARQYRAQVCASPQSQYLAVRRRRCWERVRGVLIRTGLANARRSGILSKPVLMEPLSYSNVSKDSNLYFHRRFLCTQQIVLFGHGHCFGSL